MDLGRPLTALDRVWGGKFRLAPLKRAAEVKRKRCRQLTSALLSPPPGMDEHMADGPKAA